MCALQAIRRAAAARKLQRKYRRQFQRRTASAVAVQRIWRGKKSRQRIQRLREQVMAVIEIQRLWRGMVARAEATEMRVVRAKARFSAPSRENVAKVCGVVCGVWCVWWHGRRCAVSHVTRVPFINAE